LSRTEGVVKCDLTVGGGQQDQPGNGAVLRGGGAELADGLESELHRDATALYSGEPLEIAGSCLASCRWEEAGMSAKRGIKASRRNADGVPPRPVPHGLHRRSDDGTAFMPDPEDGPARIRDDLAENLAEDYVQAATQGMEVEEDHDQIVPEEI